VRKNEYEREKKTTDREKAMKRRRTGTDPILETIWASGGIFCGLTANLFALMFVKHCNATIMTFYGQ
jgi:hypothetical protein